MVHRRTGKVGKRKKQQDHYCPDCFGLLVESGGGKKRRGLYCIYCGEFKDHKLTLIKKEAHERLYKLEQIAVQFRSYER